MSTKTNSCFIFLAQQRIKSFTLAIFDMNGREVRQLIHESKSAGYHLIEWDARNNLGTPVASGVYFYRIEVRESDGREQPFNKMKKMILLK